MKNYKVIILPTAKANVKDAKKWYKTKSPQASVNLTAAIKKAYSSLKNLPLRTPTRNKFNVLFLKDFPYGIFYIIEEDINTIFVSAVFNTKQDPEKQPK
jgi:toxin ParE1/3/4